MTIISEIDNKIPTLCLNMICKNEAQIITRLFDSVINIIDCYCICDTGSTDNTPTVIEEYFKRKNIPGKIVYEKFIDFSYNRNFALKSCVNMSDYVLLLDCDMILDVKKFDKKMLKHDCYGILQGSNEFFYNNMRIVRNLPHNGDENFNHYKYVGATHEYISTPENSVNVNFDKDIIFIKDIGDGGSKTDKFQRDIKLLKAEIEKKPNDERSHFYLANTYFCLQKFSEAIPLYEKRIEMGGWVQEVWYSYYRIGICYKDMNDMPKAVYWWLKGFDYFPDRLENLHEIISHYRIIGKQKLSLLFYEVAKKILNKKLRIEDYLFLENSVYQYKLDYEYTIIASYNGITNIDNEVVSIFNSCNENWILNNLLSNMKFYKSILKSQETIDMSSNILHTIGDTKIRFLSSSSCIIPNLTNNGYLMNIRYVNYVINSTGNYLDCDKNIITLNKYVELNKNLEVKKEKIFNYREADLERRYIGIEDIRIYKDDTNSLSFIGTGYHLSNKIGVVYGKYNPEDDELIPIEVQSTFKKTDCEKNWVYIDYEDKTHVVYNWHPLQICKINESNLELIKIKTMPNLFKYCRGSTCGFNYYNKSTSASEIWFVNHIVSYETPREYYHIFSVFDKNMNLIRYSAPFKFEGEKIEYCLSILVEENRVLCTYSTWDRTTKIAIYDKNYINSLVKYTTK